MRRKTQGRSKPLRNRFPSDRELRRGCTTLARQPGDAGASMTMLLIAMSIGLIFVTLGLFRLGYANEMRSRAQRAADAAAIAAVTPLRDMVVSLAASTVDPTFGATLGFVAGVAGPGAAAAETYARMNGSMLNPSKPPRPSGIEGRTMRVHVLTKDCEVTREGGGGGGGPGTKQCVDDRTGRTGLGRQGNAFATAKLRDFKCRTEIDNTSIRLWCENRLVSVNGSPVLPLLEIRKLFEIDLVDDEDPAKFTNGFSNAVGDIPSGGGGPIPPVSKECPGQKITATMCRVFNILKRFNPPGGIGCFGHRPGPTEHDDGRACDFMVGSGCNVTAEGRAIGNKIAAFAAANAKELGIMYIIWEQRIFSPARASEGWRLMEDRGDCTSNHMDHPHISVVN